MQSPIDQAKILPQHPGVYRYYDHKHRLLYIGKAINLRRRVLSYFNRVHEPRIDELVQQIARIEYTQTASVIEALFLEAHLIQTRQPPFNIRLKDDKTFVHIIITQEDYPRVLIARPTRHIALPIRYQFGPYTSADLARNALKIVRKIIPFRTQCLPSPTITSRGCLDAQLGLCPGVCRGTLSRRDYQRLITKLRLFLEGQTPVLLRKLHHEMTDAARRNAYEVAAQARNQLYALQHIQDIALIKRTDFREIADQPTDPTIPHRIEGYDISNILSKYAVASMVVLTNGEIDTAEYRKFQIKTITTQHDLKMMEEVLVRRFRHLEWPLPDLLVIDGGSQHLKTAQRVVKSYGLTIPILAVAKGPERKNLDLYPSNQQLLDHKEHLLPLIRAVRDEAHRFAITYHRARRDKHFLVD